MRRERGHSEEREGGVVGFGEGDASGSGFGGWRG